MFKQPPAPTAKQLAEIEKLKKEAADCRARAEESFQRCDTDGFLSQWASGITAQLNDRQIEILKNGGCATFPVLCDAEGNVVASRVYEFFNTFAGFGFVQKWKVDEARYGRRWIPRAGYVKPSRVQKALGLHEESRWFPAYAKVSAPKGQKNTGLSGCANAGVYVFKVGEDE